MPAGYSGTPLIKKLGIRPASRVAFVDAPSHYVDLLGGLPDGVRVLRRPGRDMDFLHWFVTREATLWRRFPTLKRALAKDGMIWVSWPKKTSSLESEVIEGDVRAAGLDTGLVDVKICAVDEDWSGLKFMYRLADR